MRSATAWLALALVLAAGGLLPCHVGAQTAIPASKIKPSGLTATDLQAALDSGELPQHRTSTNCTTESGGAPREICRDTDDNTLWMCSLSAPSVCNAAGWVQAGGGAGPTIFEPAAGGGGAVLTMTNCAFSVVTNRSRDGALQVNLCSAVAGNHVVIVWENAAQSISVEPKDAQTISSPEVVGTGDGLDWIATGTVGSVVDLLSISNGEWRVMSFKGAAAVDNNSGAGENP